MRKVLVSLVSGILLVSMLFSLSACGNGSKKEIENLMTEFEYACNTLDFDAVLNCINPKVSDSIKIGVGLVGMFTKTDTDELFEKLADTLSSDDLGGTDFFSSIKITVNDVSVDGENATVTTLLKYNVSGSQMEREAIFKCIYYTEKWYISSFAID